MNADERVAEAISSDDCDALAREFEAGFDINGVYVQETMEVTAEWTPLTLTVVFSALKCATFIIKHGGDMHKGVQAWGEESHTWQGLNYLDDPDSHDDDGPDLLYAHYNAIQVAILKHGRNSDIARLMRHKQFLRCGFQAFLPTRKRILTVLLCANRKESLLHKLPSHLLDIILRKIF
tara:strand:- start:1440 stop:1973 length:534 start_codon:yes stop_codon:yes gene_type:complete